MGALQTGPPIAPVPDRVILAPGQEPGLAQIPPLSMMAIPAQEQQAKVSVVTLESCVEVSGKKKNYLSIFHQFQFVRLC